MLKSRYPYFILGQSIMLSMISTEESIRRYYDDQAKVYDDMYRRRDPAWRKELEALANAMTKAMSGRRVLEVACGTGFWTEIVAKVAERVVAIDISEKMLDIAQKRKLRSSNVKYIHGNAYELAEVAGDFNAGLANFWFSHIPKARINEFLNGFHRKVGNAAGVFMCDNVYVPGIGGQLIKKSRRKDTFKLRKSSNGSNYEVLKNYYSREPLKRLLSPKASDLRIHQGQYFWRVEYSVPRSEF
jgi:ubiquinone/menaquinone biosynthesis C-methylase UbiE